MTEMENGLARVRTVDTQTTMAGAAASTELGEGDRWEIELVTVHHSDVARSGGARR